jgi:hypothetical protein
MELRIRRPIDRRTWIIIVSMILACPIVGAGDAAEGGTPRAAATAQPVGERLTYAVSWMGVHCGAMEITSFVETGGDGKPVDRIVTLVRTTKFFDGVYRLRSRLDSFFDPQRMTSTRYEEHSLEKKKRKDEVWLVDQEAMEVVRTKNGETTTIPIESDRAFDPLAYIFRLRSMNTEIGGEIVLGLMTSKGVVDTVARVTEHKEITTKIGKIAAAAVVPEPRDKLMFSKAGSMVVWIERAEPHRPCKIVFDLSFGTLVASLKEVSEAPLGDVGTNWEHWGDSDGGDDQ